MRTISIQKIISSSFVIELKRSNHKWKMDFIKNLALEF